MKKLHVLLILLTTVFSFGQSTGSIAGKLTDKEFNNEPLPFANILLKGTTTGTTSDIDGNYVFSDLDTGDYTLVFSFVGYETQEINVTVTANTTTTLNVVMLGSSASLDDVILAPITNRKVSEAATLLDQKKAVEIKQSIGAEELSRKGVSDAAGAVAKISGVSKQEGSSNVYVRGLGDRYLNTTMNGLSLPSNDVNKKNMDLNLFSSNIIENVSISKAYSSKFFADFSAGNVDITSKDYKGNGFFDFNVGSSVNSNAADKTFMKSEGTSYFGYYNRYDNNPFAVVLSHGFDPKQAATPIDISFGGAFGKSFDFENGSRLSFYATGGFENGYEYRRGSNVDYTNVEKKAFEDAEEFEYSTKTTAMASINYMINNNNSLKFNSLFINNASDKVGYFGIDGTGRNRDAFVSTDEGFYQMNVQFNQNLIYVNQLTGKHKFKDGKYDVDWGVGYNIVNAHEPDRKRISVENYQFALDDNPLTSPIFYSNVVYDNQRYFQNIEDNELNSRLNLAYNPTENTKINMGFAGRAKERQFDNIRYGYGMSNNTEILDVNNLNSFFTLDNLLLNEGDGGLYEIEVFRSIPGLSNTNRPGLSENTYTGNLDVYAGYLNAELNLDENWLLVPGVRVENISQDIAGNFINLGNTNIDIAVNETVFLPSLSVKYGLNDDQNLRFSASQTISLPEFKEVAPFVYESISQRIGGNPDLLGRQEGIEYTNVPDVSYSSIINLDLKYEWFMSRSELFSVGAFYKQINDPVNQVVAFDATGTQRFFRTGEKAEILGFEIELRKNILMDAETDNPKLSGGFNLTYMHTQQDLYESIIGTYSVSFNKSEEQLQGASPIIFNADINYSPTFGNYKPTANLIFSYFSDRIDALGSGQLGNVIEKGIPTLDFVLKNKLTDKMELNFGLKNILNPTIQYLREGTSVGDVLVTSPNGKDVTNYKRGLNVGLQFNYKF